MAIDFSQFVKSKDESSGRRRFTRTQDRANDVSGGASEISRGIEEARQTFNASDFVQRQSGGVDGGNQFIQAQQQAKEDRGFFGKARDFATNVLGGGKLAQGAGQALAAPGIQEQQEELMDQAIERREKLIAMLNQARQRGEDTSRLEQALRFNQETFESIGDTSSDFSESLVSDKQVLGSAARLAGTAASGGAVSGFSRGVTSVPSALGGTRTVGAASKFAPGLQGTSGLFGAGRATGALGRGVRGAAALGTAGAAEGAIQGAGVAAEQEGDAGDIAAGGTVGGFLGLGTGGTLGFVGGTGSRLFQKARSIKQQRNQLIQQGAEDSRTAQFVRNAQGKVETDPVASEVIKQGVDEGTVTLVKGANKETKSKLQKMLDRKLSGSTKPREQLLDRPAGIAGESVLERFNSVANLNKQAAQKLGDVAQNLKGTRVGDTQIAPVVNDFVDDLTTRLEVQFKNGKPVFPQNSFLEGQKGAQDLVKRVVNRLSQADTDAFELHKIKKFIDEQVEYGKTADGITGTTEAIVKNLRRQIDEVLDTNFPEYNQVNTQFSETKQAIDQFGEIAGKRFDPNSLKVNEKAGTLLRRVTSNALSRSDVIEALDDLESTARRFGKDFDDDLITQVDFFTELERLFGSSARTSFQGQIENVANKATGRSLLDLGVETLKGATKAARDVNEESLERSLKELLQ